MKLISLAVRDFAVPVPRRGSIEAHSGYGRAALDGQEIHLRVQQRRAKDYSDYRAEVPMTASFDRGAYRFSVGARVDGFFASETPKIEEIKSCFSLPDLARKLTRDADFHPYCLQLKTYGYFYWLEHQVVPKLSFHLVSTRNFASEDLELSLDVAHYEAWLALRLDELTEEAKRSEKRSARRRKTALDFAFPFAKPRPGQLALIQTVEEGMAGKHRMLLQAPTGLGKTAGVLYPALKEALQRGQKVMYVTPKNSQHAVAEDAVERFQAQGAKLKALTVTAKGKICFKAEPLCNPEYCEFARDHYTKVAEHGIPALLARKRKLTSRTFQELGEQFEVCPYELQLEAANDAEVVICDYNYVFAPRTAFGPTKGAALGQEGKPNLVIDEAHNLLARAIDYYSPALSSVALEKMRTDVRALPQAFRGDAEELLNGCQLTLLACRPEGTERSQKIEAPAGIFLEQEAELRKFLSKYLDSDVEIRPRDVVLRLCFYWSEFTAALQYTLDPNRKEFFTTYQPHASGGATVKITCCDASPMLEECYEAYEQVVGFSATLKPFDYYAKLSGLDPETIKTAEFASPFPRERRKLLIIPQISTKYSEREKSYGKIADAIARIVALRSGNYFVFFPSFDFLGRVLNLFKPPEGFVVLNQQRDTRASEVQAILEHLRQRIAPTVLFAVQGGTFSEGVDYPGEMIIGAFVIGPPLPTFDLEREQMRAYYDQHYGAGFDYAYTFPAMAKAVQAAGRVIRSETDRGLIVLMDNRFLQPSYAQSLPTDWFAKSPQELVSGAILKEVADFWDAEPA